MTADALITLLEESAALDERTLRNQTPDGKLSDTAEAALIAIAAEPDRTRRVLRRYAYIKHLFLSATERLAHAPEEATESLSKLLQRDPVPVDIGTRTVYVTGRSWAAYRRIASHASKLNEVQEALLRTHQLTAGTLAELALARSRKERARPRRNLRRLGVITRALHTEALLHRQAVYAHLFTEDGRPAESLDDAPSWWTEITPAADVLLMKALWTAGPETYAKSRAGAAAPESSSETRFGWHSHFAHISHKEHVPSAEPYARDFYQHLAYLDALADAMKSRGSDSMSDDDITAAMEGM